MKPRIVVVKDLHLYDDQKQRLESLGHVTYYNTSPRSSDEWFERCVGADIICTGLFGLKSEKVYALQVVFISLPFTDAEFLDTKRLRKRNIVISNAPGCNKEAVVEWIVGMLLLHYRKLSELVRTTESRDRIINAGPGLYGKNITILGAGNIGNQLKHVCESLGMNVTMFRRADSLLESVRDADIVANCLSANNTTTELLDRKFFFSLKKGSFFISIARSHTYDISALKDALDQNILVAAADDAASAQVGDTTDSKYTELLQHPRILVTPHIAWNADSERRKSNDIMIDNIEAWKANTPIHVIDKN